jgi:penicillin-binding protein-related factor A (putative recombinase)
LALRNLFEGKKSLDRGTSKVPGKDVDKRKQSYKDNDNHPQKVGKDFEGEIKAVCEVYRQLKIAYIQQFFLPTLFIPPNFKKGEKVGKVIYRKKTGFDFIGGIVDPKNAIFIEAKSTQTGEIPVWQESTGIKIHQMEELLWLQSIGFYCLILWKIRSINRVMKMTPQQVFEMGNGKNKITLIDCDDHRIPRIMKSKFSGGEYYDFLGKLESFDGQIPFALTPEQEQYS